MSSGGGVAGVKFEGVEAGGFGEGLGGDGVGFRLAVLADGEMKGAGVDGLQRGGNVDGAGLSEGFHWYRSRLPEAVST